MLGMLFEDDVGIIPSRKVSSDLSKINAEAFELLEAIEGELGGSHASKEQIFTCCAEALRRTEL